MNKIRYIVDIQQDAYVNIAIDEMFFIKENFKPVIRFYTWQKPAFTIGYFQKYFDIKNKNNYPVVRRLTGGLAVLHENDLSYSIIMDETWPYLYDQEKTYEVIHGEIKKALAGINIICDKIPNNIGISSKSLSCVKTFYKNDLLLDGKKIVGSCQRRRGKRILVEGSIHVNLDSEQIKIFTDICLNNISKFLNCKIEQKNLSEEELSEARNLVFQKYNTDKWKQLF